MGLDMYLTAHQYLNNWGTPEQTAVHKAVNEALNSPLGEVQEVTIEVAYWRKANAIHRWFVNNVQEGVDECQTTPLSRDKLEELLIVVNQVVDDHDLAHELLPASEGFFFGGQEYDEWYFEKLSYTKQMLEKLLTDLNDKNLCVTLYYHASW